MNMKVQNLQNLLNNKKGMALIMVADYAIWFATGFAVAKYFF